MLRIILKQLFLVFCICLANKQALAITGEEISAKVSDWLIKEGINGKPIEFHLLETGTLDAKTILKSFPNSIFIQGDEFFGDLDSFLS